MDVIVAYTRIHLPGMGKWKRLFQENGWGDLTHEMKAKVVLHTVDLWRSGALVPEAETLVRARAVVSAVNSAFEKLFANAATPV